MTLLAPLAALAVDDVVAFPGAEGFGRFTTGGRGGKVIHVTTLDDGTQSGTFRYACNQTGKRTIVFDVSGTIYLTSELQLKRGDVTIAGQTAPGDGVCIADYPFTIKADNVIIRYMRFRLGNRQVAFHEGDGLGGMDRKNIIIDHCSVSWSVDECLSVYGSHNITIQWCIAAWSMVNSGHTKGAHGYGGNWGGAGATYHHNLVAHNTSRTPRFGPRVGTQTDERMDYRNNVIYNWAGEGCYGAEAMTANVVNNYYKPGPGTNSISSTKQRRLLAPGIRTTEYTHHDTDKPNDWDLMWHVWGKFFVEGNVNSKYSDVTADNWKNGIINQVNNSKVDNTFTSVTADTIRLDQPMPFAAVTTHSAADAYSRVLDYVGCSLRRDALDITLIDDARNGKATYTGTGLSSGFINTQDDCGGWPTLNSTAAPLDTDQDGMPDSWETAHGLNPNSANDGKVVADNGYTNLENYLNSLVDTITQLQNAGGTVEGFHEDPAAIDALTADKNCVAPKTDATYNLQGMRLDTTPDKGLYITGGKKIVR